MSVRGGRSAPHRGQAWWWCESAATGGARAVIGDGGRAWRSAPSRVLSYGPLPAVSGPNGPSPGLFMQRSQGGALGAQQGDSPLDSPPGLTGRVKTASDNGPVRGCGTHNGTSGQPHTETPPTPNTATQRPTPTAPGGGGVELRPAGPGAGGSRRPTHLEREPAGAGGFRMSHPSRAALQEPNRYPRHHGQPALHSPPNVCSTGCPQHPNAHRNRRELTTRHERPRTNPTQQKTTRRPTSTRIPH